MSNQEHLPQTLGHWRNPVSEVNIQVWRLQIEQHYFGVYSIKEIIKQVLQELRINLHGNIKHFLNHWHSTLMHSNVPVQLGQMQPQACYNHRWKCYNGCVKAKPDGLLKLGSKSSHFKSCTSKFKPRAHFEETNGKFCRSHLEGTEKEHCFNGRKRLKIILKFKVVRTLKKTTMEEVKETEVNRYDKYECYFINQFIAKAPQARWPQMVDSTESNVTSRIYSASLGSAFCCVAFIFLHWKQSYDRAAGGLTLWYWI